METQNGESTIFYSSLPSHLTIKFSLNSGDVVFLIPLNVYLHLFEPFCISLSFYSIKVVNGIGEMRRDGKGGSLIEGWTREREMLWVSFASTGCVQKNKKTLVFTPAKWLSGWENFIVLSLSLVQLPLQPTPWLPLIGHIYPWLLRQPLALVVLRGGSLTNKLNLPLQ